MSEATSNTVFAIPITENNLNIEEELNKLKARVSGEVEDINKTIDELAKQVKQTMKTNVKSDDFEKNDLPEQNTENKKNEDPASEQKPVETTKQNISEMLIKKIVGYFERFIRMIVNFLCGGAFELVPIFIMIFKLIMILGPILFSKGTHCNIRPTPIVI